MLMVYWDRVKSASTRLAFGHPSLSKIFGFEPAVCTPRTQVEQALTNFNGAETPPATTTITTVGVMLTLTKVNRGAFQNHFISGRFGEMAGGGEESARSLC